MDKVVYKPNKLNKINDFTFFENYITTFII